MARGIAGSFVPELEGGFLNEHWSDVEFFATFRAPIDVWAADRSGLVLEDGPDGWRVSRERIPASRPRLIQSDDWNALGRAHRQVPSWD